MGENASVYVCHGCSSSCCLAILLDASMLTVSGSIATAANYNAMPADIISEHIFRIMYILKSQTSGRTPVTL